MARITINDVAAAAGVSKATVSYVLNRRSSGFQISEETAIKVLQCCQKMNYRPDEAAIRLSECRKTPLKLLVASPWLYAPFSDFMVQLNRALHHGEQNSPLTVAYASYDTGSLRELLRASLLKRYDAVIVAGTSKQDNEFLARHAGEMGKVILLNRSVPGLLGCSGNDTEATAELVSKLNLAHYAKCLTAAPSKRGFSEALRCDGFIRGCAAMGRKAEFLETDSMTEIPDLILSMMRQRREPLLVFIPRYVTTAILLQKAREAGIGIPENLGIITYDRHSLLDQFVAPALTTVDPLLFQMASEAIEMCFALREHQEQPSRIVKAKIILGKTTINLS